MAARVEFPRVFTELKKLFRPFARRFKVWFGGVQQGKAYVSFHLIGVYAFPGILKGVV